MIEIFKDEAGGWRYRIKGRNGEPMATSEAYTSPSDARRGYGDLQALIESGPEVRRI